MKEKINKVNDKSIDVSMFWNAKDTLSHNRLFNVIVGNRGGGKSFGCKELCIDNFIKKREQFVYVRRYKEDLKVPMQQFFTDIAYKYPDYEFKVERSKFYMRIKSEDEKQKWTDEDICGYGFALSTSSKIKSMAFPFVTTIVFDEFLIDKGMVRYIEEEPTKLLDFYETIARPGTNHPRVVMFLLANAITITNPYFLYWNLKMPIKKDGNNKWIWKHKDKSILVEDVKNETFINAKKDTEFGKIIEGTKYADYSIDNKFILDDDTFIEKRTPLSKYWCTLKYKNNDIGIWIDKNEGLMYASKLIDPTYPIVYAVTIKDHKPNTLFLKNRKTAKKYNLFIECYKQGLVRFEDMKIKNITYEIIQLTLF